MIKEKVRKIILSLIILLIGISSYTGFFERVFVEKTFVGNIDKNADAYLDKTMKKALFTFAIVRGINAIISVIQDSDVAVSPAGVGITIAVGEILDPVNDLIERFSWVVLASTTSLGVQKILMNVASWLGFKVLLTLSMLIILVGLWAPQLFKSNIRSVGYKLILLSILVRFCIPAVAIATDKIDGLFLDKKYTQATKTLETVSNEIKKDEVKVGGISGDENILSKVRTFFSSIKDIVNMEEKVQSIKDKISNYIEYIIDLIVIFILQTIIVPLIILWLLMKIFSSLLGRNLTESAITAFKHLTSSKRPVTLKK